MPALSRAAASSSGMAEGLCEAGGPRRQVQSNSHSPPPYPAASLQPQRRTHSRNTQGSLYGGHGAVLVGARLLRPQSTPRLLQKRYANEPVPRRRATRSCTSDMADRWVAEWHKLRGVHAEQRYRVQQRTCPWQNLRGVEGHSSPHTLH